MIEKLIEQLREQMIENIDSYSSRMTESASISNMLYIFGDMKTTIDYYEGVAKQILDCEAQLLKIENQLR